MKDLVDIRVVVKNTHTELCLADAMRIMLSVEQCRDLGRKLLTAGDELEQVLQAAGPAVNDEG